MSPRRFWIALAVLFPLSSWQLLHALENGTALSSAPSAPARRSPCVPFILGGLLVGTILVGGHRFLCPGRHPPVTLSNTATTSLPVDLTTKKRFITADHFFLFICGLGIAWLIMIIVCAIACNPESGDESRRPVDHRSTSQVNSATSTTTGTTT